MAQFKPRPTQLARKLRNNATEAEKRLWRHLSGQHDCGSDWDQRRTEMLENEGFRVIRFWNNDVLENSEGVLTGISEALNTGPPPPASGRGVETTPAPR